VDRAPLPPHERPWRHPSELGPPGHEPTSTSGRVIIATAATLSLLLVGLLVVSMTPDRAGTPQTVSATTSGSGGSAVALEQPRLPLVTPIGDDGWAITTTGAVKASTGRMAARLPSGEVVDVDIVSRDEEAGFTVVSLPTQTSGYHLATNQPAPTDTVAVRGRRTQVVEMVKVSTLHVEEAAPVVDDDGDLVGLCSTAGGTVEVRTVSTMPAAASSSTTAPSTTLATTVPPAPTAPTTTAAGGVAPTTAPATTAPATTATAPSTTAPGTVTTMPAPTTTVPGDATSAPG
jgi:hypothetical protein